MTNDQSKAAAPDLYEALKKVKIELAALIHPYFPGTPAISDWPCENPGDRECLDAAWHIVADALANVEFNSISKPNPDTKLHINLEVPENIIIGACNILDTAKMDLGNQWSEWDQSIRDGLSAALKSTPPAGVKQIDDVKSRAERMMPGVFKP